jgi:ribosomal protein S27AE
MMIREYIERQTGISALLVLLWAGSALAIKLVFGVASGLMFLLFLIGLAVLAFLIGPTKCPRCGESLYIASITTGAAFDVTGRETQQACPQCGVSFDEQMDDSSNIKD